MGLLDGKVVIITGANRGIGRGIVDMFVKEGAQVSLNSRDAAMLEKLAEDINANGGKAFAIPGDMGDPKLPDEIVHKTLQHFGSLDVVVSNAGTLERSPTADMTLENWHHVMDVNLTGPMLLSRAALEYFKGQKKGKVIFISSVGAKSVNRNAAPAYGCSKAATTYLMRHLATEYGSYGITVNSVLPGFIETDISKDMSTENRNNLMKAILLGRHGTPTDVAGAVLFFASELGNYCTGECLDVNGGLHMD